MRVEMQKIQQLFRKYVRLGGLEYLKQRLVPPLLMPERFLTYLEQKRDAMQFNAQNKNLPNYVVPLYGVEHEVAQDFGN